MPFRRGTIGTFAKLIQPSVNQISGLTFTELAGGRGDADLLDI